MKCYMTSKPCDYYKPNVRNDKIFIISPFGFPYDSIYSTNGHIQDVLKKELKLSPHRSDQTMRLGSIMCQGICKEIIERQYLMVDISEPNPNVYYELGLAYAVKKNIVALLNKHSENNYLQILKNAWQGNKDAFIAYDSIQNLEDEVSAIDLEKTIKIDPAGFENDTLQKIIILENGHSRISGLFERIIQGCMGKLDFSEDLFKGLTEQERNSFNIEESRKWAIETVRIDDTVILNDMICDKIASAKICIIDTTAYRRIKTAEVNPYMYFFLGLAHGLEKEVVPLTNATHTEVQPFDVKGLWHIFFTDESSLEDGLLKIIPKISIDFHLEQIAAPYNKIWDGFLENKESLSIIYCGRPNTTAEQEKRGRRTNIDSWDSKTVSEATFYLAQKYPTTVIRPSPPEAKSQLPHDTKEQADFKEGLRNGIESDLKNKYPNCMIVGSPDVSDYAEVILAKLYKIDPFDNGQEIGNSDSRFVFYKHNLTDEVHSSFYREVDKEDDNKVYFFGDIKKITKDHTYGVITIAKNPFCVSKDSDEQHPYCEPGNSEMAGKVLILSGYTGIATFGLLRLLIDVHMDYTDQVPANPFNTGLLEKYFKDYDPDRSSPFSALVEFKLKDITEEKKKNENSGSKATADISDNRRIEDVEVALPKI